MIPASAKIFETLPLIGIAGQSGNQKFESLLVKLEKIIDEKRSDLIELFYDLHKHPEVSGKEMRTSGIIAGCLREMGIEVKTGIGGYGRDLL